MTALRSRMAPGRASLPVLWLDGPVPGPITKKEGKWDFFLVGEIADDDFANRYLKCGRSNLNAALDIRGGRLGLRELSRGLADPGHYFSGFDIGSAPFGSHRNMGDKLMSVLDDHD
jgi:hypothetical protein